MYPNRKTLKVLEAMCDMPNRWVDVMEVARIVNLTSRQVSTAVISLPKGTVEKARNKDTGILQVKINGTEDELHDLMVTMTCKSYGITDEVKDSIRACMDEESWVSVPDIAEKVGLENKMVIKTLQFMDNVDTKCSNKVTFCRKKAI